MSCSRDTVTVDWGSPMMQFGQIRAGKCPLGPVPHRLEGGDAHRVPELGTRERTEAQEAGGGGAENL